MRYEPRAETPPTIEGETLPSFPWEPFLELLDLARAELTNVEGELGKELEELAGRDNAPRLR